MATRRKYGTFTPKRRAALKKASLISARKRSRNRKIAVGVLSGAAIASAGGYALHRHLSKMRSTTSGSKIDRSKIPGYRPDFKTSTGWPVAEAAGKEEHRIASFSPHGIKYRNPGTGGRKPVKGVAARASRGTGRKVQGPLIFDRHGFRAGRRY